MADFHFIPTRRALLLLAIAAPVAAQASAVAAAAATTASNACVDPDALPRAQKAMRASLNFRMVSEDPKRQCGGCAFYTAKQGACGSCALLSSGPVPAEGVCDSWAARK